MVGVNAQNPTPLLCSLSMNRSLIFAWMLIIKIRCDPDFCCLSKTISFTRINYVKNQLSFQSLIKLCSKLFFECNGLLFYLLWSFHYLFFIFFSIIFFSSSHEPTVKGESALALLPPLLFYWFTLCCRCNKWASVIGRPDLIDLSPGECQRNHRLCSEHFLPEDFDGDTLLDYVDPTLFGGHYETQENDEQGYPRGTSERLSALLIAEDNDESEELENFFNVQLKEFEEKRCSKRRLQDLDD